jgi:hypothetical protein
MPNLVLYIWFYTGAYTNGLIQSQARLLWGLGHYRYEPVQTRLGWRPTALVDYKGSLMGLSQKTYSKDD